MSTFFVLSKMYTEILNLECVCVSVCICVTFSMENHLRQIDLLSLNHDEIINGFIMHCSS